MDVIQHKQKELSAINQYASLVTMQKATLEAGLWQVLLRHLQPEDRPPTDNFSFNNILKKLDMNYTPNPLLASSSKTNLSPLSPLSPANHAVTPSQQLKGHPIGSYPPLLAETTEGIVVGTHHGLTTPMFLDSWPQGMNMSRFRSSLPPASPRSASPRSASARSPVPRVPSPRSASLFHSNDGVFDDHGPRTLSTSGGSSRTKGKRCT